jgi:hypothetical protein
MFPCSNHECTGLIKTINGRCNKCENLFCVKCIVFVDKYDGKETIEELLAGHTCDVNDIENAKKFLEENKLCPNCHTIISRTSGCS